MRWEFGDLFIIASAPIMRKVGGIFEMRHSMIGHGVSPQVSVILGLPSRWPRMGPASARLRTQLLGIAWSFSSPTSLTQNGAGLT